MWILLSLEKARELAKVLPWEPKVGDMVYLWNVEQLVVGCPAPSKVSLNRWTDPKPTANCIFAPRLDQLLAEIERHGWNADSVTLRDGGYGCDIYWLSATVHTKYETFTGESREDAAAVALLWILEKEHAKV